MGAFSAYAFQRTANVSRYDSTTNTYLPVESLQNIPCDVQRLTQAHKSLLPIESQVYFPMHYITFPNQYDIWTGDKVMVDDGQEYAVKLSDYRADGISLSYTEVIAGLNTLIIPQHQTTIYIRTKLKSDNYNPVFGESFGDDIESRVPVVGNIEQTIFLGNFGKQTDMGIQEEYDLVFFCDVKDIKQVKVDDTIVYDDENYQVKFKFKSPTNIAILGLKSMKNETL